MATTYIVLDLETTVRCPIGKNKASPHWDDNTTVLSGLLIRESTLDAGTIHINAGPRVGAMSDTALYVGHNIKFDLLHRMKQERARNCTGSLEIWDTQLAEYLITGQRTKYSTLDALSEKYGGTLKDNRIKEMWEAGVQTEDIPSELLKEYLENDLKNTEIVFHGQVREAERLGLFPLIKTQMAALLATTEMEFNGMAFDSKSALALMQDASREISEIEEILLHAMSTRRIPAPNLQSKVHISAMLFGGTITYTTKEVTMKDGEEVRYKTGAKKGELKYSNVTHIVEVKGYGVPTTYTTHTASNPDVYVVDEAVLTKIASSKSPASPFCKLLLKQRELHKDINTYYKPYIELVFPDGCIHGNLNHCSTSTGRLASTNPNLQNVTNNTED